jgi:DNA-binding CsgD family transcriptional regulator
VVENARGGGVHRQVRADVGAGSRPIAAGVVWALGHGRLEGPRECLLALTLQLGASAQMVAERLMKRGPLVAAKLRFERSPLAALTAREREVLAEIAKGKSNAAIADTLVLTKRAVEKHINSIFLKLNLAYAEDVSKGVKATLLFLANADPVPPA